MNYRNTNIAKWVFVMNINNIKKDINEATSYIARRVNVEIYDIDRYKDERVEGLNNRMDTYLIKLVHKEDTRWNNFDALSEKIHKKIDFWGMEVKDEFEKIKQNKMVQIQELNETSLGNAMKIEEMLVSFDNDVRDANLKFTNSIEEICIKFEKKMEDSFFEKEKNIHHIFTDCREKHKGISIQMC